MTPQVGDTITTAEELDALPIGSIVVPTSDARESECYIAPWQRCRSGWDDLGGAGDAIERRTDVVLAQSSDLTATVLYIPGHPPRPEREVAAKVLREAAADVYGTGRAADCYGHPLTVAGWLRDRADRIAGGAV